MKTVRSKGASARKGLPPSKPPTLSRQHISDRKWVSDHLQELIEKYPNRWIMVYNGWSYIFYPIIDTGSPVTLLPKRIWREISVLEVPPEPVHLQGIGEGAIMARLAKIELALLGTRKEIVNLSIKAYLAENDSVPLLFGIENILTDARLVCDYPKSKAFLQIA